MYLESALLVVRKAEEKLRGLPEIRKGKRDRWSATLPPADTNKQQQEEQKGSLKMERREERGSISSYCDALGYRRDVCQLFIARRD